MILSQDSIISFNQENRRVVNRVLVGAVWFVWNGFILITNNRMDMIYGQVACFL